ncbi:MAG: hypothetical protein R2778_05860 [Saprospiraceae bacterium]
MSLCGAIAGTAEKIRQGNQALIDNLKNQKILSQSMSGFNDALTASVPNPFRWMFDPLARTPILKEFTEKSDQLSARTMPSRPFLPICFYPLREGPFQIRKSAWQITGDAERYSS